MSVPGRLAPALLALVLGACQWAPFDESLLDGSDAGVPVVHRDPGSADDPRQTGDGPAPDAGVDAAPAGDDGGGEPSPDFGARRGSLRTSGELEPNDSMAQAQPAGLYFTVLAEWTPAGDDDWYSVELLRGDHLEIRTRADDGGCDFDSVLLVYPEGARPAARVGSCTESDPAADLCVDDVDDSPCARLTFEATETGTYYVRAVEYGNDAHALYTIDFELVP